MFRRLLRLLIRRRMFKTYAGHCGYDGKREVYEHRRRRIVFSHKERSEGVTVSRERIQKL